LEGPLIPYQVEIVTAITIILVVGILTVYLSILKKNGWIGSIPIGKGIGKGLKENAPQSKLESKTQNSTALPIETKASSAAIKESQEPKALKTAAPTVKPKENKSPEKIEKINYKKSDELKQDKPAGCNHYFGYLRTLPKGTNTPDECYCCTRLIDCYKETKN
jgi:hypothetical protein